MYTVQYQHEGYFKYFATLCTAIEVVVNILFPNKKITEIYKVNVYRTGRIKIRVILCTMNVEQTLFY